MEIPDVPVPVPEKRRREEPEEGLPPPKFVTLEPGVDVPIDLFESLPDEIILRTLAAMDPASIGAIASASRRLNALANDGALWRALFRADFVEARFVEAARFEDARFVDERLDASRRFFFVHWPLEAAGWIGREAEEGKIDWRTAYETAFLEATFGGQHKRRDDRGFSHFPYNRYWVFPTVASFHAGTIPEHINITLLRERIAESEDPSLRALLSALDGTLATQITQLVIAGENPRLVHVGSDPRSSVLIASIWASSTAVNATAPTTVQTTVILSLTTTGGAGEARILLQDVSIIGGQPGQTLGLSLVTLERSMAIGKRGTNGYLAWRETAAPATLLFREVGVRLLPREIVRWHPFVADLRWRQRSIDLLFPAYVLK